MEREELMIALNRDPNFLPARVALARSFNLAKEAKSALQLLDQMPAAQKGDLEVAIERNWALIGVNNPTARTKELSRACEWRAPRHYLYRTDISG